MRVSVRVCALSGLAIGAVSAGVLLAQASGKATRVTIDNFPRAESHLYFGNAIKSAGGVGKLYHYREAMPIGNQTVIRANRDTFYSSAVVDLDAGPVTMTLPDSGGRFRSLMVINEDHYIVGGIVYDAGKHVYDRQKVGTRYALVGMRTFVDPGDPSDIKKVHSLQDATTLDQKSPGALDLPNWDPVSQKKVREALLVLATTIPDFKGAFGSKDQVDPIRHLIGSAAGWGGNPEKDAYYLNVTPPKNDGTTVHTLTVKDVPVDGFWSISLYNAEGYFEKNSSNAYSLNNVTAAKDANGAIRVQFGGCDGKAPNCLPIMKGWNYTVRLYRPRTPVLDGTWKFPDATPAP